MRPERPDLNTDPIPPGLLREHRLARNLSQGQAASRFGMGLRTWQAIETGGKTPAVTCYALRAWMRYDRSYRDPRPILTENRHN